MSSNEIEQSTFQTANQSTLVNHMESQQRQAQKLFEEKLKESYQEKETVRPRKPNFSNSEMSTSKIETFTPKITREQEIQTETLRASMTQSTIKEQSVQPSQNRRLVTVSTNTSIAFDGIPKIQDQKTHDLSIEIPLEEAAVQSQEDLSDMLNESALMMSNLDMLKSFDFTEMKKSSDSNLSHTPAKSKEPVLPQHHDTNRPRESIKSSKQSQEIESITNSRQSVKSSLKSTTTSPSPSSSQTSDKLQKQKQQAKQELQQQMSMLRYEIQLAEEAYSRRKKELIEERKRQR